MNKEWSELNKAMQAQISKNDTYKAGIDTLFDLRNRLMEVLSAFYNELNREEFNACPFLNADGYHNKTIPCLSALLRNVSINLSTSL